MYNAAFTSIDVPGPGKRGDYQTFETATQSLAYMLYSFYNSAHTTIYRWVQRSAPELEKRCRSHLKATNDSWRVDETYIKVKKVWMYLYRAVDSAGNTLLGESTARHGALGSWSTSDR